MDVTSIAPESSVVRPRLLLPFRLANSVGNTLRRWRLPFARMTQEKVTGYAIRTVGRDDFGDPYYLEGLHRLLESLESDAHLHFLGRLVMQGFVELGLMKRLWLVEALKARPEIFRQPLRPPLIVIGLPRTGTTFLHRMLATDPAHRAVPMWELMRPLPNRAFRSGWKGSPWGRRYAAKSEIGLWPWLARGVDSKHYLRPDEPEECMWLLDCAFVSLSFWVLAPVYGYLEWYSGHDRFKPYADYRRMLQALGAASPGLRLTLKAPAHTGSLDALQAAVPEAMVVQMHRDPVTACKSFNSLLYTIHGTTSERIDPKAMASANLKFLANEAQRNLAVRNARPDAAYDVHYRRLVADPIGTVRDIYDHFGLDWPQEHEARLAQYVNHNPKGAHGSHEYDSAAFGLSDGQIAESFGDYCRRFDLVRA